MTTVAATEAVPDVSSGRPLSPPEQRVWLLEQLQPGIGHVRAAAIELHGRLELTLLQAALDELLRRHPALRTAYVETSAGARAVVMPPEPLRLEVIDHDTLNDRLLGTVAPSPFDLTSPPLLRALLAQVAPGKHVLLLEKHALGCDESAESLLIRELCTLYGGATLPDPIPYAELAEAHRARLQDDGYEEELRFWRDRLGGSPMLLDLPADHPRPPLQSYRGARVRGALPDPVNAGLDRRAVIIAAFAALLTRWSGQTGIVLGLADDTPAGSVGPVGQTLVLDLELGPEETFTALVSRSAAAEKEARLHAVPFERLVEEVNPERDLSRSPIFQAHLAIDEEPSVLRAGQLDVRVLEPTPPSGRYDVAVRVRPGADELEACLDYNSDLFAPETMARFFGHLQVLLRSAIQSPLEQVRALPILSDAERNELLAWNATEAPCPSLTLHGLVAERAAERPDAIAVEGEDGQLNYAELDRRSSQLAHHLVGLGVERGELVGICLERSAAMMVALLGVLKTGAAYVPLDPTYPAERQAFMLADAQVPVLLTEQRLLDALPEHSAHVVCVDGIGETLAGLPSTAPCVVVEADDLAYVIYTSGSTGRPKGVEIRHRSVVNLLEHMQGQPGLDRDDVVANLTTFAFDLSVPDLYLPLTRGAKLVVLPRDATFDGIELASRLEQACATFVQATPTTWQLLVDSGWAGSTRLKIVCGGEPLSHSLAHELLRRGESLWHMYGPTETTVWSSIRRLEGGDGPPPIGGPIANTRFYVLDDALQLTPHGVPGQLYIGGTGVAQGYRGRPDLTGEKFLADPFVDGERIYATGDFVRRRVDDTLEFLGRIDHQVKLRGFRVELPEIEAVLCEHGGVRTAVAVVREDAAGDPRLVAYVTLTDPALQSHELRRHLVDRLPPYMVPSAFVTLDELPETSNRKVDRSALPRPDSARPASGRSYIAPRTPLERLVAATWGEVLGLSAVGVDDDFFELGGNSLLATQVLSRLQRELAITLPLRRVFELPRLADLAESIVETMAALALDEGADVSALLGELEQETSL